MLRLYQQCVFKSQEGQLQQYKSWPEWNSSTVLTLPQIKGYFPSLIKGYTNQWGEEQIDNTRDHRNQPQRHYTSQVWLHDHNPSSWESEAEGLPQVRRHPWLHSEFKASLSYPV